MEEGRSEGGGGGGGGGEIITSKVTVVRGRRSSLMGEHPSMLERRERLNSLRARRDMLQSLDEKLSKLENRVSCFSYCLAITWNLFISI